jgi:hypothetical protein
MPTEDVARHSELKRTVNGECTHISSILEFDFEPANHIVVATVSATSRVESLHVA